MQLLIKLQDGIPTGYPLLLSNVEVANNILAASNKNFLLSSDVLSVGYGVFVRTDPKTNLDYTKKVVEVLATEQDSDGNWLQKFVLENIVFDSEEDRQAAITDTLNLKEATVRDDRNDRLALTDWTSGSDVVMSSEMAIYRTALRNVPDQVGFPDDITWPWPP
jgi:hypothetical protein